MSLNKEKLTYDEAFKNAKDYFKGDDLAASVFISKYAISDDNGNYLESTPEEMHMRMAKEYARELFVEPENGLLIGEELTTYIKECIAWDYKFLKNNKEFFYLVEDALLNYYEKKKVKKCCRCKKYYPGSMYQKTAGDLCDNCRTGALLWI